MIIMNVCMLLEGVAGYSCSSQVRLSRVYQTQAESGASRLGLIVVGSVDGDAEV